MLQLDHVDVFYGPVQALRGVSLTVGDGEMVALLGANGAGKTTTLRTISGLLEPRDGSIVYDGTELAGRPASEIVRLGISQLPQGRELFGELTVRENLRLGYWSRRHEREGLEERIEEMFELFPRLRERADQAPATMSDGEQQMLAASRALMSRPSLLLVDELSMGLAPILVDQLFEALVEVNRRHGTAILVVEQFVQLALQHTSRAYVLAKGEVALSGESNRLLGAPELLDAYLGDVA
jgi:branched-chain amino acid transport system ATP-binding protein